MKKTARSARWFLGLSAALLLAGSASAADVKVMISAGYYHVYEQLAPKFEKATGNHLVTVRGPSMGDSPEAIPTRLARGEAADVVIMDGATAEELGTKGLVRPESKRDLALSQIGMVVHAGAPKPKINTVDALRKTLLAAKSIAYSDSGSGTYISTKMYAKLGIADQVAGKSRKVRGPPSGEPVAAVIARNEAEVGFQQMSELMHVKGVDLVGPIPASLQPGFSFAGVIAKSSEQPEAAAALIKFLASAKSAPVVKKMGLTPVPAK
ncbi:MAG TPA: substrate-binding domain-containing protein [Burkholderiales bacterium]|jgi:molybdate transport system substrate-binding protein